MRVIQFPAISSTITIALAHTIMILRVFALYGIHPILVLLVLPFICEVIVMALPLYMAIGPQNRQYLGCMMGGRGHRHLHIDGEKEQTILKDERSSSLESIFSRWLYVLCSSWNYACYKLPAFPLFTLKC
ncbi:hypothetical protein K439DRAFT_874111 [Ramaria rubella]|nr:hypothetical protein K439DRAFT_874111 [Ramaria rubella]